MRVKRILGHESEDRIVSRVKKAEEKKELQAREIRVPVETWELIWKLRSKWVGNFRTENWTQEQRQLLADVQELLGKLQ